MRKQLQMATVGDKVMTPAWNILFDHADHGRVLRAALFGAVLGTATVLGMELHDHAARHGGLVNAFWNSLGDPVRPLAMPEQKTQAHPLWKRETEPVEQRSAPQQAPGLTFTTSGTGTLSLRGTIQPGSARKLREVLETAPAAINTVTLDSPGGSLNDAMAMARLIRQSGLSTRIEAGATCASSCPLVLAGGTRRSAAPEAMVAVHQFYSPGSLSNARQALSDAQLVTARISRHLDEMGVEPALWLHALDTPPRALYRLSPDEMRAYRLVTTSN